ncbi:MAG: FAD-linked oxidase C-terminal domain-containing protein [Acidimicrobiales bacterium]
MPGGLSFTDSTEGGASGKGPSVRGAPASSGRPTPASAFVAMGVIVETFETACTWDRFADLHAGVVTAVEDGLRRICGGGWVTCRFTHVYPDGCAPYFSVFAPGRWGSELAMWQEIKAAAAEAILAHGGTITHHHAVGRDHRPWYDQQRPDLFAGAAGRQGHPRPGRHLQPRRRHRSGLKDPSRQARRPDEDGVRCPGGAPLPARAGGAGRGAVK